MEVTPELVARLRQEADVSREEAARLLAAHEGSLLDTLLDLERQGQARPGRGGAYSTRPGQALPPPRTPQAPEPQPRDEMPRFARRLWDGLRVMLRILNPRTGNQVEIWWKGRLSTAVPIVILLVALVAVFHIVAPLLILGLLLGCRYRCAGPDLDRRAVNDALGAVADAMEDWKRGKHRRNKKS